MTKPFKIGHGYDVHKLISHRPLILGGVYIPYDKGLLGHSDADVLLHAIMDAVLGALGLGDIGRHFPDTDDAYQGANSLMLCQQVCMLMQNEQFAIGNIDATILAERPKLAPFIEVMKHNIADAFACDANCVNIKATTEEGLGFTGDSSGIAAHAVCLLYKKTAL
ncbi:MAG: 2-C-methyl-D-erythritol 2,4-cyclodiphosphate synthase [Clostridiales bacterium]|nr:2-C-methyl-D-erythritol 2,4-cyclodiphosphate synthase [Clostridiales bacterium]